MHPVEFDVKFLYPCQAVAHNRGWKGRSERPKHLVSHRNAKFGVLLLIAPLKSVKGTSRIITVLERWGLFEMIPLICKHVEIYSLLCLGVEKSLNHLRAERALQAELGHVTSFTCYIRRVLYFPCGRWRKYDLKMSKIGKLIWQKQDYCNAEKNKYDRIWCLSCLIITLYFTFCEDL